MIAAYRIVLARFADEAFTGKGARANPGRWHDGIPIVYTSSTIALATLELLAHLRVTENLEARVVIACFFPEALVEPLNRSLLPANWNDSPAPAALQKMGNEWAMSRSSAVLEVPSAIVPAESNYLLNPLHDDFKSVDVGVPRPFELDYRLLT